MSDTRINEAEVIALSERKAKAQSLVQYALHMLDVCTSVEAEDAYLELLDENREVLDQIAIEESLQIAALDKP